LFSGCLYAGLVDWARWAGGFLRGFRVVEIG